MTDPRSLGCRITVLTPPGRGAIASIAVRGDQSTSRVDSCLRPARGGLFSDVPCGRVVFGHWTSGDGYGEEVVACRKSNGEIEIHCHGGLAAPQAIVSQLQAAGAVVDEPEVWAEQQIRDPLARAARLALSGALTTRTASVLLDQYRGSLGTKLREARNLIQGRRIAEACTRLEKLLRFSELGQRLTRPWRVVFAGRPNVGKSSLVNAILGYRRAIVMDTPGTTRDVLTAMTALEGWPVELIDTAGLRTSTDEIEFEGVARAQEQLDSADLVIRIEDSTASLDPRVEEVASRCTRHLVVHNKCDLLNESAIASLEGLATSAITGRGVDTLMARIVQQLVPAPPPVGEAVPFEPSQVEAVRQSLSAIKRNDSDAAQARIAAVVGDV